MSSSTEAFTLFASSNPGALSAAWSFLWEGGFFMLLIVLCSILAVAVVIFKSLTLKWERVIPPGVVEELENMRRYVDRGDVTPLQRQLEEDDSPLSRAARVAVAGAFTNQDDAQEAALTRAREEVVRLESGLAALEVIITIAPLLGLLGTVSGLVEVFAAFGQYGGDADPGIIATGIAKALNTTIAGLVVTVPAVIAHSYFSRMIEAMAVRMEVILNHTLGLFYRYFEVRHQ